MNNEYNITLEQAKETGKYKFVVEKNLTTVKEEIKKMQEDKGYNKTLDIIAVLTFGHIDIELTHRVSEYGCDYCMCIEEEETGWNSYDILDDIPQFDHITDSETLEKTMFKLMMDRAKKDGLTWSKLN